MTRPAYTRAELLRLIAPRSIALVGASPRAGSFGMRTLENLAHYTGEVLLVNPKVDVNPLRYTPDRVVVVDVLITSKGRISDRGLSPLRTLGRRL
ncbi:MAG: CoA-binding protein [Betaproteobacteria bacterium]|nr:CoA-binding protein [Betaproteobacteria bacterium]